MPACTQQFPIILNVLFSPVIQMTGT
jgi:hypothetical protein